MKKFIELIKQIHQERYSAVIQKILTEKIPVAFLSISPLQTAIDIVKNLYSQGLNITHLIINNSTPPPQNLDFNLTIISLDEIYKIQPRLEYVLVTNEIIDARVAAKYFVNEKIIHIGEESDHIYEMFMNHVTELQEVYESLIDERSRRTFCGYWLGNISKQFNKFVFSDEAHYMTAGFIPKVGDVVIDCGVCDGGTATYFVNLGCKVYGFEMDKSNFELAKKVANEKGFIVENFGLGSYKHAMNYTHINSNIGASKLDENGTETAEIITIDSYVGENKLPSVDFIKMDVEGAELDILKGATTTIARYKPILALSAYHKWDDFWVLMNFVKSIRSDYEFVLRHFAETRENTPFYISTNFENKLAQLGLEPVLRSHAECCLLAR